VHSISGFIELLRVSHPLARVKLLSIVVITMVVFVALYVSQLKEYTAPDVAKLIIIEGRVSGHPNSWEHNRSLVHFSVAYKLDGKREGKPIYTYWELYEQSGLRINSKVLLTVERQEGGSVVRGLSTLYGRVLYDDRFNQQVIAWNNESINFKVFLMVLTSIGVAAVALATVVRYRRELFQGRIGN